MKKKMNQPTPKLDKLVSQRAIIQSWNPIAEHHKFLKEEISRFISIGGTLAASFENVATSIDERIISHILLRSAIENFFKVIYIFDSKSLAQSRFDSILDGFRLEYRKLYNSLDASFQNQIEPADQNWSSLSGPLDLSSMLAQVRNTHGTRLDELYFIYRIGSFDTHGNSLNALFQSVFQKQCNFPYLKICPSIELIADQYNTLIDDLVTPPTN